MCIYPGGDVTEAGRMSYDCVACQANILTSQFCGEELCQIFQCTDFCEFLEGQTPCAYVSSRRAGESERGGERGG